MISGIPSTFDRYFQQTLLCVLRAEWKSWPSAPQFSFPRRLAAATDALQSKSAQAFLRAKEKSYPEFKPWHLAEQPWGCLCYHTLTSSPNLMNLLQMLFGILLGLWVMQLGDKEVDWNETNSKITFQTNPLKVEGSWCRRANFIQKRESLGRKEHNQFWGWSQIKPSSWAE